MVDIKPAEKNNLTKADLRAIATGVVPLIVLVLLSVFVFRVLFARVNAQRASLSTSRRDEQILLDKQELLTELRSEVVPLVEPVTFSIPHKNASLMMIAQVKQQALQRGLFATNLKTGPGVIDNSLLRYELQFDLDGDPTLIFDFVSSLASVAPISKLESLTLSGAGGLSRGEVVISVYSAPLPENLPAITEPITEFTSSDLETISILTSLIPPPFFEVTAQEPGERENPFE